MTDYTIESKYGVQPGEDWLAVRHAASYKVGQRVNFGHYPSTIIDIRRITRFDIGYYEYRIRIDPGGKWNWKGDHVRWVGEINIRPAARDQLNGLGASAIASGPPDDFDPVATRTGQINTDALDDEFEGDDLLWHQLTVKDQQLEKLAQELAHQMEIAEKRGMEITRLEKELKRQQRRNTVPSPNELTAANARIKELEAQLAGQGDPKPEPTGPQITTLIQSNKLNQPEKLAKADAELAAKIAAGYRILDVQAHITTTTMTRHIILIQDSKQNQRPVFESLPRTANGKIDRKALDREIGRSAGDAVAEIYGDDPKPIQTIVGTLVPGGKAS